MIKIHKLNPQANIDININNQNNKKYLTSLLVNLEILYKDVLNKKYQEIYSILEKMIIVL